MTVRRNRGSSEVSLLLKKAKKVEHSFYPVWVMALFTGMRSGELYALEWSDIDLKKRIISVSKQWTSKDGLHNTKTNKCRLVPISDALREFLESYRLERKPYKEVLKPSCPPITAMNQRIWFYLDFNNGEMGNKPKS